MKVSELLELFRVTPMNGIKNKQFYEIVSTRIWRAFRNWELLYFGRIETGAACLFGIRPSIGHQFSLRSSVYSAFNTQNSIFRVQVIDIWGQGVRFRIKDKDHDPEDYYSKSEWEVSDQDLRFKIHYRGFRLHSSRKNCYSFTTFYIRN